MLHVLLDAECSSPTKSPEALTKEYTMKHHKVLTLARASVLAGSVLLPLTTPPFAQTPSSSAPEVTRVETRGERDYTGLWGLLGLLGLAGLAGRRRRGAAQGYTTPEHPRPEAQARR
jgi:MYXO-CTERM domain-containing protein